jgi:hypothetical protein
MSQLKLLSVVVGTYTAFIANIVFANAHEHVSDRVYYREETSFGTIRPDDVAKPAQTDLSPGEIGSRESSYTVSPDAINHESTEKPKYRDIYLNESKRSRSQTDDESVGFIAGVGFGFKQFLGQLGLNVPLNKFAAWRVMFHYLNRTEEKEQEINTSGDVSLIVKLPNPTPLTPFVSAGPGYESWKRSSLEEQSLEVFDNSGSLIGTWSVGGMIKLAKYVSLVGDLKSITYAENSPRSFDADHYKYPPEQ